MKKPDIFGYLHAVNVVTGVLIGVTTENRVAGIAAFFVLTFLNIEVQEICSAIRSLKN
ncbi:MAG: hypothetical protein UU27_C0023G0004 [Parcubacteria group bacterium GW2011_GWD1_40_9]|nr:MAG: hypothetical protein UU27_C0023G0004 [Parcubacteria group bacterium GW2011_GWD1_40_9]